MITLLFTISIAVNGGLYLGMLLFSTYKLSVERDTMSFPGKRLQK